jgi:ankyrin repeat protein
LPLNKESGKNILHLAVENRAVQIVAYMLLDLNLDPNVFSACGKTILHMAIDQQNL